MTAPCYVLASMADAAGVLRRLARDGWTAREGFALPEATWDLGAARLLLYGRVSDPDTARLVVLAAARGAGVLAVADPAGELGRAMLADLRRLGPVRTGTVAEPEAPVSPAVLLPEQRALLDRLANGETIAAAAAAEYLSLRTANRRIASARTALGVATTREAVLAYLKQQRRSLP